MKLRETLGLLGEIILLFGFSFLVPLVIALHDGTVLKPFLIPLFASLTLGILLRSLRKEVEIGAREAFLLVSLAWIIVATLGALPYIIAGEGSLANPLNALFESMSGFTTTGATVMEGFSDHSRAILFWRQLTQWLGGMGIVVLAIAILPRLSVGGSELMALEAPGPQLEKLTPSITNTARIFWTIYLALTALETLILSVLHYAGLAPKMTPYMALIHSFTTMSTGGFSPLPSSIGAFSPAVHWVIALFMVLAGANFALFWYLVRGQLKIAKSEEFRWYVTAILTFSLVITPYLVVQFKLNTLTAFREAFFQVASITTTTGYATMDFSKWVPPAQFVLFFAMFFGGSSGSTAGSVKIIRWITAIKAIKRELFSSFHPNALIPIRLGGKRVEEHSIRGVLSFIALYFAIFFASSLFVVINGASANLGLTDYMSAVAATLGNIGPGIGGIGPMANYLIFPPQTRALMIVLMWFGRLEVVTVLVLFTRSYWRW